MIGYFPEPYPGELFYSVCARFAVRTGIPTAAGTMQALFGRRHAVAIADLPHDLDSFVRNLPPGHILSTDRIIDEHTLFPFYAPFLDIDQCKLLRANLCTAGYGADHLRSGICAGRIRPPTFFRSCPECDAENLRTVGETYWHRLFQITGVEVCPKHRVFLADSSVRLALPERRHVFLPAPSRSFRTRRIDPANRRHQILLTIAEDVARVLDEKSVTPGIGFLHERYLELLEERRYIAGGGQIRVEDLRRDFIGFFTPKLLSKLQSPLPESGPLAWLGRIVRKPKGANPPLRHFLMMAFLKIRYDQFMRSGASKSVSRAPFSGPWPCLNLICNEYKRPVITQFTTKYRPSRKSDMGYFACPFCGFTYGLWDWNEPVTRPALVLERGPLWLERLRKGWFDKDMGLCNLAAQLGVDPHTAKQFAARLGLPFPRRGKHLITRVGLYQPRRNRRRRNRDSQRASWLELKTQNSTIGRSALRMLNISLWTWLYRHDRAWLASHSPTRQKAKQRSTRADWNTRDEDLAERIANLAIAMKRQAGKPVRVTKSALGRQLGCLTMLENHIDKLRLTESVLRHVAESVESFAARRVRHAASSLRSDHWPFERWELIKAAGLRKAIELLPAVQRALDYEMSYGLTTVRIIRGCDEPAPPRAI